MQTARLLSVLHAAGLKPTAREMAEAIWLAAHAQPPRASTATALPRAPVERLDDHDSAASSDADDEVVEGTVAVPTEGPDGTPVKGHAIRIPDAPALPQASGLRRSLRPFRRRVSSPHRFILDEAATAQFIAATGVWSPVTRPEPQRWLEVALVVDACPSMRIWRDLVGELRRTLISAGAFRNVRLWYLVPGAYGCGVATQPDGPPRRAEELIDPTGRRIYLIVTDAASDIWRRGDAARVAAQWARIGPTVVLQPLPERLWDRTGLPTLPGRLFAPDRAVPNRRLRFVPRRQRHFMRGPTRLAVPVLHPSPEWLAAWANLMTSPTADGTDLAVALLDPFIGLRPDGAGGTPALLDDSQSPLDAAGLISRFVATASPDAYQLAVCLSAVPLNLPVMRVVQHVVQPGSTSAVLAEVLLSGLLQRLDQETFEFLPGIRPLLRQQLRRSEEVPVTVAVRMYIDTHPGVGRTFAGVVTDPAAEGSLKITPATIAAPLESSSRLPASHGPSTTPSQAEVPATSPIAVTAPERSAQEPYGSQMHVVLVGPPGAGKGTQADFLAAHLGLMLISTGNVLRANVAQGTKLGIEIKRRTDAGELIPDTLVINMIASRLGERDPDQGFLLDGFPRTVPQAAALDKILSGSRERIDLVVELVVDEDEVIRRLSGRRTCNTCGKIWHVEFDPTQRPGVCDRCGGELFQRDDDKSEVIAERLRVYARDTAPLIDYYGAQGKLVGIDATGPVEDVTARMLDALRFYPEPIALGFERQIPATPPPA